MDIRSRWIAQCCAVLVTVFAVFALSGCDEGPGGSGSVGRGNGRTAKFESVEEHLSNSKVRHAVVSSGHQINRGGNPPFIAGAPRGTVQVAQAFIAGASGRTVQIAQIGSSAEYSLFGRVVDSGGAGEPGSGSGRSRICLVDQSADGSLKARESLGPLFDNEVLTADGFITGSGDKFTTLFQSHQDIVALMRAGGQGAAANELGVCVLDISVIMSGRRATNGDFLDLATLSTVTDYYCPNAFDFAVRNGVDPDEARNTIEQIDNSWWKVEWSSAEYQGRCSF